MVLKFNLIIILMFLLLAPSILSQGVNTQVVEKGYIIVFPEIQTLKQGEAYTFHFHIFNNSNGYPIISGLTPLLHIYNSSGKHIIEAIPTLDSNNKEYKYYVGGGNFSIVGHYSYIIQVNDTKDGGADKVYFEVTPSGRTITEAEAIVTSVFFIFSVLILLTFMYIAYKIPMNSPKEMLNTTGLLKQYRIYKIGAIAFSYFILIFVLALAMGVSNNYLYLDGFYKFFQYFYSILVYFAYPVFILTIILGLIIFIYDYIWIKKLSKFIGEGGLGQYGKE